MYSGVEEDPSSQRDPPEGSRFGVLGEYASACRLSLTYLDVSENRISRNVLRALGQVQGLGLGLGLGLGVRLELGLG